MVENLGKLLSNVLEIYDSMEFNILILYEKVLKGFRKTVHCALGFGVPTVSAGTGWRSPTAASSKTPRSRSRSCFTSSTALHASRLTGSAASWDRTQLRPENSCLLHRGFTSSSLRRPPRAQKTYRRPWTHGSDRRDNGLSP